MMQSGKICTPLEALWPQPLGACRLCSTFTSILLILVDTNDCLSYVSGRRVKPTFRRRTRLLVSFCIISTNAVTLVIYERKNIWCMASPWPSPSCECFVEQCKRPCGRSNCLFWYSWPRRQFDCQPRSRHLSLPARSSPEETLRNLSRRVSRYVYAYMQGKHSRSLDHNFVLYRKWYLLCLCPGAYDLDTNINCLEHCTPDKFTWSVYWSVRSSSSKRQDTFPSKTIIFEIP